MNLRSPLDDLLPGTRGQVVSAIAQLAHPVTVRTLAKHAGVSPQTALDTVNDLSDVGLIHAARAGQSLLVTLNRDHLLADPLRAMVETRGRLLSRLTDHRAGWRHLSAAWLFGSAARGDGGRHSDIDLLVVADRGLVTDEWTTAVTDLHSAVETWAGNRLQLVEHTRARLHDAEDFLEAAEHAHYPDVIATNAIHSAIASADALCCFALRERSADGSHLAAVELLGQLPQAGPR